MKRAISFLAVVVAGIACLAAAYFCHFYYGLYRDAVTGLESRINGFDLRLAALEAHKARELKPIRVWGMMSTIDQSPDTHLLQLFPANTSVDGPFEIVNYKGGPSIVPEIRLPVGSTNINEFDIHVSEGMGTVTAAWLSPREQYPDFAAFEWLNAYCPLQTNVVKLIVRLKPNARVKMRFEMVILCQR